MDYSNNPNKARKGKQRKEKRGTNRKEIIKIKNNLNPDISINTLNINDLKERSANFFYKVPDSKYLGISQPYGLHCNYSTHFVRGKQPQKRYQ